MDSDDPFDLRNVITHKLRQAKFDSMRSDGIKSRSEQSSLLDFEHKKQKTQHNYYPKQSFSRFHKPKVTERVHIQEGASRSCVICSSKIRNMKKHVIMSHVTDDWWGVYGDTTCWKCQEFHTAANLRKCKGFFDLEKDTDTFLYRNKCYEEFLKEDLQCNSRTDPAGQ